MREIAFTEIRNTYDRSGGYGYAANTGERRRNAPVRKEHRGTYRRSRGASRQRLSYKKRQARRKHVRKRRTRLCLRLLPRLAVIVLLARALAFVISNPTAVTGLSARAQETAGRLTDSMRRRADDGGKWHIFEPYGTDAPILETGLLRQTKNGNGKTVVIDAGHGGKDVGCLRFDPATGGEVYEKDINLAVALLVRDELEKKGYTVILTRKDDTFLELSERTDIANTAGQGAGISPGASGGDGRHDGASANTAPSDAVFVSIHVNYMENDSVFDALECYCNVSSNAESERLASAVLEETARETGMRAGKFVTDSDFYVVRHATVPACLFEIGYLSSDDALRGLTDAAYQKQIARGIANGTEAFFQTLKVSSLRRLRLTTAFSSPRNLS